MRELVSALSEVGPDEGCEFLAYVRPDDALVFPNSLALQVKSIRARKYSLNEQLRLAYQTVEDDLDVLHVPFYVAPILATCPVITTIHDVQPFLFPGTVSSRPARLMIRFMHQAAAWKSSTIITPSQRTGADLEECLPASSIKIRIIPEAAGDAFEPSVDDSACWQADRKELAISGPFFVGMLGKQVVNKNSLRLLHAHRKYRSGGGKAILVMVGNPVWAQKALPQLVDMERLGSVVVVGHVERPVLRRLYRYGQAFIYPSIHEGFGLPILEAFRSGGILITSKAAGTEELASGIGWLVDPMNEDELAARMRDVDLLPPGERQALVEQGRSRAAMFSWKRTASETIRVYRQAAQGSTRRPFAWNWLRR